MNSWQAVLIVFFVLLPLVLMLDFWGDERLTARGRPIPRQWHRQVSPASGRPRLSPGAAAPNPLTGPRTDRPKD